VNADGECARYPSEKTKTEHHGKTMQLKSLKIFCDIVRRRSFSQAALENGISQSSASQVVHQLEEQLGVQLLDRSKRPFVLTPEGECYFDGSLQLVSKYAQLKEKVRALHDETSRRLLVASIYSVGLAHMSAFMRQFSSKHPNAQVRLEYLHPARVYEVVENGEVDLGLVSYPQQSRSLDSTSWRNEPLVMVCHPEHRLALRQTIALNDLAGEPFVAFEKDLRIRAEIDRALLAAKVEVNIDQEFDNVETMKRAIEVNEGLSILPEPTLSRELASRTLARIPLEENLQRPLGIIHRRDREFGKIGQQFIQLLRTETEFTSNGLQNKKELITQ